MDIEKLKKNPEQVKELISLLSSLLDVTEDGSNNSSNTKPSRTNKFLQMSEFKMHKEDADIDKKLHENVSPIERSREFEPVQVTCRICGKKEKVSPSLVSSYDRYKCNRCSGSSG